MAGGNINYTIGFKVDKTGLNQLKSSLQDVQKQINKAGQEGGLTKEFEEARDAAKQLEKILDSSWNNKLGQLNLNQVNKGIKETYGSVGELKKRLEQSGAVGSAAYNKVASSILNTNLQLRQSNKFLDSMAESMANTVKWGITSSIFNSITSSISKAWSYTKNLDSSLNDIRVVTELSAEKMDEFAVSANKAAKALGASTLDYTNASLIYYQQGLSQEEVDARAEVTLKAANVTGQSADTVSEQLTAVWNGYKVSAEEAELYIDKLAAVAATTASDLQELSTGMSKVASAANLMGVDIDQLNAQMATIISVTRQAPESVGTALKTIYARMGDIEAGLDTETTLGEYTSKMADMGINVLDANNELRDMGAVIEEIGGKWQNLSREQQIALSQTMAGTRQYNNLLSLFDNWDMYTKSLNESANAAGALQNQQDIYMERTEAHLQQLRTETQRTYDILFNPETANGFIDAFTGVTELFNNFIEGIGGGGKALLYLGSIAGMVFNEQIARGINNVKQNWQVFMANLKGEELKKQLIAEGVSKANAQGGTGIEDGSAGYEAQLQAAKQVFDVRRGLTQEQYNETLEINKQIGLTANKVAELEKEKAITEEMKKNLSLIGVDENANNDFIKRRISLKEQDLATFKEQKMVLNEILYLNADIAKEEKTRAQAVKELTQYEAQYRQAKDGYDAEMAASGSTQRAMHWETIVKKIQEGKLNLTEFNKLLEFMNNNINVTNQGIENGNNFLRARSPELAKEIEAELKKLGILKDQNTEYAKQAKKNVNTQTIVKGAMTASMALTSLAGAIQTFSDESTTGEQKAHSMGSAIGGIATAIGSAFGPMGMAIGMGVSALSSLFFSLDGVEDAFKSTEEKAEELREELSKLEEQQKKNINEMKNFTQTVDSLEEVRDEFERLSQKAGEYDKNIDSLTEKERKRYNELKQTILENNAEALLIYNAEGEAILKKNEDIQTTIDLLKEELELKKELEWNTNWESLTEARNKEYNNLKENLNESEDNYKSWNTEEKRENYLFDVNAEYAPRFNEIFNEATGNQLMSIDVEDAEAVQKVDENLRPLLLLKDKISKGLEITQTELDQAIKDWSVWAEEQGQDGYFLTFKDSLMQPAQNIVSIYEGYAAQVDSAKQDWEEQQAKFEKEKPEIVASDVLNTIKYIDKYNGAWKKLADIEELDMTAVETSISDYITSLEFGKDGIESYEDAYDKTQEYVNSLYEFLNQVQDPNEFLSSLSELDAHDFSTIDEYNAAVQTKIKEIVDKNKEFFKKMGKEETEAFFENMFGLSDVVITGKTGEEKEVGGIDTGYKQKANDISTDLTNESIQSEEGVYRTIAGFQIVDILTPEKIDRFDEVRALVNETTVATQGWSVALEEASQKLDKLDKQKAVMEAGDSANNLMVGVQSEDITSENIVENEDYDKLIGSLDEITKEYSELTDEARILKNENLVGTQKWLEALDKVKSKIDEVTLENLRDQAGEAYSDIADSLKNEFTEAVGEVKNEDLAELAEGEISIEALLESENFESHLDDLLNADYAITLEIHSQAEEEFNSVSAAMDSISEKASLIGEDFIVAADDIRELNNAFPGIIDGMTSLEDGSVQLKDTVVENAMTAAQAEVVSDAEATNEKLQNAATELRVKQQTYQAMADAAFALAQAEQTGETDTAVHKQTIQNGLNLMRQESTNAELTDAQKVANNANNNAGIMASNWAQAYGIASEKAKLFAITAIAAHKAAVEGKMQPMPFGDFGVNYNGANGVSSEATQVNTYQNQFDSASNAADWQALGEAFQNAADVAGQKANDIEGMIAENAARTGEVMNSLNNTGKKKGGGSGGGDDKTDQMEAFKDELDIYREINNEIERLNGLLTKQENITSKLHGSSRIKSLQKEIDLLEEHNEREKDKLELMYAEQANMQAILKEKAPNVEFDENGVIANYSKILQDKAKGINDAIVAYNSMSKEQQESEKENIENMKKDYEDLKKLMESYDTHIVETIPEQLQKREENLNKRIEKQIEIKDIKVEIQIDKNELRRTIRDFIDEYINDEDDLVSQSKNSLKNFKSVATNNKSDINTYMNRATEDLDAFDKIVDGKRDEGGFENDAAAALESAKTNAESMQKAFADAKAELEEIEANLLEGIDKAKEAFEEQHEKFSQVNDDINHNLKLYQMLNGEDSNYGEQVRFYEAMEQNNLNRVYTAQKEVDFWEKRMKKMTEGSEEWKKAQENCIAAQNQLNSLVEESIENIKNKYHAELKEIVDSTTRELTGGWGLDTLELEWELLNKEADMYLDKVNGAYEIHKLETKTVKALRDNSALAAQERINNLMNDELKKLREKDKLTKYEVERANQLLDLELKKIALAEAQQNKSTMRLRRDAQGNYSYQYTSDQDAIDNAQAEVDEAQNSLYNLDKDEYKNNLEQMLNNYGDFQAKALEIYTNNNLTREEKEKQLVTLQKTHFGVITSLAQDNELIRQNLQSSTFDHLKGLQEDSTLTIQDMTNDFMDNIVPQWDSGIQTMAESFAGKDGEGGFADKWTKAFNKMKKKTDAYQASLETLATTADTNFTTLAENAEKLVTPLSTAKSEVKEINKIQGKIIDGLITSKNRADEFASSLNTAAENAKEVLERLLQASQVKLPEPSSESSNVNANPAPTYTPSSGGLTSSNSSSSGGDSGGSGGGSASTYSPSASTTIKMPESKFEKYVFYPSGITADGVPKIQLGEKYTNGGYKKLSMLNLSEADFNRLRFNKNTPYYKYKDAEKVAMHKFNTGGYTGSWANGDKDGKLAVLHQKELVLNSSDTTKILDAVNIARKLDNLVNLKSIDMSSISALDKIADAFKQVLKEKAKDSNEVKQSVEINANFPNVSSKNEIEEAFEELINLSSQYAFSTGR